MSAQRQVPVRTCISCRCSSEKKKLIRVVRTSAGDIVVDKTGKLPGRGAYVCASEECLKNALKTNKINRALKCDIPEQIKNELQDIVVNNDVEKQCEDNGDRNYGS